LHPFSLPAEEPALRWGWRAWRSGSAGRETMSLLCRTVPYRMVCEARRTEHSSPIG
jgi:hypothetical protein